MKHLFFLMILMVFALQCTNSQTSSLSRSEQVQLLKNDPLLEEYRAVMYKISKLSISSGKLKLGVVKDFIVNSVASDDDNPCNYLNKEPDLKEKHPTEYTFLSLLCEETNLMHQLEEKHPICDDLTSEESIDIFYLGTQVTFQEAIEITKNKNN